MFERVLNAPLQLCLFHAWIVIKKNVKIKYIDTNLFKDLSGNTLT